MAVILSDKRITELAQAKDPKQVIFNALGDLSGEQLLGENVLVASHVRSEKTKGGIIRPTDNLKEDVFQGKTGLIVKVGDGFEEGDAPQVGTWVLYSHQDGLQVTINEVPCRILPADRIRMVLSDPNKVL